MTRDALVKATSIYPDHNKCLWDERVRELEIADVFEARFSHLDVA